MIYGEIIIPDRSLKELHLKPFRGELSSFSVPPHAYLNQLEAQEEGLNLWRESLQLQSFELLKKR